MTVEFKTGSGSNNDYYEYEVYITNASSSEVTGVEIVLPTSGQVNVTYKNKVKASYDSEKGGVLVYYSTTIPANSTVGSSDMKFGFTLNGNQVTGDPYVTNINCASSGSSGLKYTLTGETKNLAYSETPVGKHGALKLAKLDAYTAPVLVGEDGNRVALRGASTHGMHWSEMGPYVNEGSFHSLRDEWGVNTVRLVNYVTQGGYTNGSQSTLDALNEKGIKAATDLGMYVILDWHIHAENPWTTIDNAKTFFTTYANKYKDYDNILFEICNEPTGVQWYTGGEDLYSYCKTIIKIIRDCGSDAPIICGTNNWSQDVNEVVGHDLNDLTDDGFENILYTLHFYSATHYDNIKNKATEAYSAGVPIFVTEFGTCDASGNGSYDFDNATAWINYCDERGINYCNWSLCNKSEVASMLSSDCTKTGGGWTGDDLSESGVWLVNTYRAHQDAEDGTDTSSGESSSGDSGSDSGSQESSDSESVDSESVDSESVDSESGDSKSGDSYSGDNSSSNSTDLKNNDSGNKTSADGSGNSNATNSSSSNSSVNGTSGSNGGATGNSSASTASATSSNSTATTTSGNKNLKVKIKLKRGRATKKFIKVNGSKKGMIRTAIKLKYPKKKVRVKIVKILNGKVKCVFKGVRKGKAVVRLINSDCQTRVIAKIK